MILKLNAKSDVQRLAEENIRLAYKIAEGFNGCDLEKEEVQGFALLGLTKAAANFDESKGFKFSTYAVPCIRNEILQELRRVKNYQNTVSLDAEIKELNGCEMENCTLLDMIPDVEKGFDVVNNSDLITSLITCVNKCERECLTLIVLEEKRQEEAAQILGISQSYVSRRLNSGIKKVRKAYWRGDRRLA